MPWKGVSHEDQQQSKGRQIELGSIVSCLTAGDAPAVEMFFRVLHLVKEFAF
jgi:hypothetical protein